MELREIFNKVISEQSDPDAIAELEVCREFFTNPEFKSKLEEYIWTQNQKKQSPR